MDTIVAIQRLLKELDMNDEFMLRGHGDYWEAHACNLHDERLGELDGMFYTVEKTPSEALAALWDSVASWYWEARSA